MWVGGGGVLWCPQGLPGWWWRCRRQQTQQRQQRQQRQQKQPEMDTWSNSSVSSTPLTRQSSDFSLRIEDDSSPLLDNAIRNVDLILNNQTKALSYLTNQYRTSQWSIGQMKTSLRILNNSLKSGGKIIISGMGKSFKIASKTVATLNSLRMHSALLHPSEALHGDLGMIREDHNDSLIIISASGNSPELLQMLEHVSISVPIILMTCNKNSTLAKHSKVESLLLAELPSNLSETNLYGLSAPTITTTLCLTLLDATAIALSELHINDYNMRKSVFSIHHPGGAIGINHQLEKLRVGKAGGGGSSSIGSSNNSVNSSSNGDINKESSNDTEITMNSETKVTDKSDNHKDNNKDNVNGNGNGNGNEDCLDIGELVLIKRVQNSKYKCEVDNLPATENEFLRFITVNDFIILEKSNKVLDCEVAKDIYRGCQRRGQKWPETLQQLRSSCVEYRVSGE